MINNDGLWNSKSSYDMIEQEERSSLPSSAYVGMALAHFVKKSMVKDDKQSNPSTLAPSNPTVSTEVNAIQSTQSFGNKKKGLFISLSGLRLCLHMQRMVRLPPSFFLTM